MSTAVSAEAGTTSPPSISTTSAMTNARVQSNLVLIDSLLLVVVNEIEMN
jgi:hypothetical protein